MKIRIRKVEKDRFELDRSGSVSVHFRNCVPYYSLDRSRLGIKEEGGAHLLTELFEPSVFELEGKVYDNAQVLGGLLIEALNLKKEELETTRERVDRFEEEVGPRIKQTLSLSASVDSLKDEKADKTTIDKLKDEKADKIKLEELEKVQKELQEKLRALSDELDKAQSRLDNQQDYLYVHRERQDEDLAPWEYEREAATFELKTNAAVKVPSNDHWIPLMTLKSNRDLTIPSCQLALSHSGVFFRKSTGAQAWDQPKTSSWEGWRKVF